MQPYVDSLVRHFSEHPPQLDCEYRWPRGKNAIPYEETFARRVKDAKRFATEPACRTALAIEMIKWGGITRGLEKVPSMADETPEQLIARGLTRVATWSKILTLHDPYLYQIYDARVAFSLNYIFHTAGLTGGVFPMVASRNTHIVRALAVLQRRDVRLNIRKEAGAPSFYRTHLELARGTAEKLGVPAWQIEMGLFARGPELAKSVSTK